MTQFERQRVLVVEDDIGVSSQLEWALSEYDVDVASDRVTALDMFRKRPAAVVTLDLGLPPDADGTSEGMATLQDILEAAPATKVIVASGHAARESAQSAIALGAYDFYAKPIDINELKFIVRRAFHLSKIEAENVALAQEVELSSPKDGIITGAPEMHAVLRTIGKVASSEASLMLLGASGTGKELLAKAVHAQSSRAERPFVAINCAAIPETLLESELFGFEKGAFTGAVQTSIGKIESAQGGTLFLDEIGDVPASVQVKILRFLQERVIERIGSRKTIPIDVRVVTATHRDIKQLMVDGVFREDLYFRLAEVTVAIPSLAERTGDAALLARHFMRRFRGAGSVKITGYTREALEAIAAWPWPGNVRELENRVKRATIMAEGTMLTAADLDLADAASAPVSGTQQELRTAREHADRQAITNALAASGGNMSAAARSLNISRPMLYNLIKTYKIASD